MLKIIHSTNIKTYYSLNIEPQPGPLVVNPELIPPQQKTTTFFHKQQIPVQAATLIPQPQVQRIYNPVPVMTHYNVPVIHHIPVNQVVKKYIPVYYPVPVEHKINIPVRVPVRVEQKV